MVAAEAVEPVDLVDAARWVCEESLLFADTTSPFRASMSPGDPGLVVVVGENAAGKSLLFRVLCSRVAQSGALPVTVSIRERVGAGAGEMSRMRQVFMFGDEAEQSTGATSVRTVMTAFENLDRPAGSVLGLDEPELGLSDGYAEALGRYIGDRARTVPDVCTGVVVVTHNRRLVRGLLESYAAVPTFVHAGAPVADLDAWLADTEVRSVDELLALPDTGLAQWRATLALLKQ